MDIAILGLGTIGSGVYDLLQDNPDICVKRILDIRKWMDIMTTDINDIVNDPSIEVVVETMGGLHPAYEFASACLNAGKSYITANKFLVSEYASELKQAADKNGAAFLFSAACGGGIPYLSNLSKVRAVEPVSKVGGIFNGTTNYILDNIFTRGETYDSALKKAQELGYAERDPSADVDGLDTQRKLVLACAVAEGSLVKPADIPTFGIRNISKPDIDYAVSHAGVIRLTANADLNGSEPRAYVCPSLCSLSSIESSIHLNVNFCRYEGERIGQFTFSGQGAGKYPTANNIIRDIYCVMKGEKAMLPDVIRESAVNRDCCRRFYIRTNEPEKFESIAGSVTRIADQSCIETEPVSIGTVSDIIKESPDTFVMIID